MALKSLSLNRILFVLIGIIILFSSCGTNNWPQFRGPNSNQLTSEKVLPLEWSNENNMDWKYDLDGRGWSCPIVWENQIFFTNAVLEDPSILPCLLYTSPSPRD